MSFAQCDGLILVAEPLHRDDRPEDLLLDDLGLLVDVGHDGRLVVEPVAAAIDAARRR